MQETLLKINELINNIIWGPAVLILFIAVGAYFSVRTGFFQFTKIKEIYESTIGNLLGKRSGKGEITPFKATATALAGTMGTGNIVGIATAITIGGAGAVFWMWVSAVFGMMTKFAEIVLAIKFREKSENGEYVGGPMYYIKNGLGQKIPAVLFSLFCVLASFGIGNMTQINSIAQSLNSTFNIPFHVTGIAVAVLIFIVIIGGVKRIASITSAIIPILSVFYFIGCAVSLLVNVQNIPGAFKLILSDAFDLSSIGGAISGYAMINSMKYGFSRGVFSNEAGLGSAPIIHAAAHCESAVKQGMWGIFEVFVDTIVVCTLTALVIITSGALTGGENGAVLTATAFENSLGGFAGIFIALSITLFAFSTLVSWSYYGEKSIEFLTNSKFAITLYRLVYVFGIIPGAMFELKTVWEVSDTLNGFMALPNMYGIILLSPVIINSVKDYMANDNQKLKKHKK